MGAPVVPRRRLWAATLAIAVGLATAGVFALPFQPTQASAGTLPPAPVDFALSPGETLAMEYTKPMVNSAELRPDPDGCRNNPAIALTCDVKRIKLKQRVPGYFLRIETRWTSQGQQVSLSVPDVDTYLFDNPTSYMDYNQVGGVSGANPEQIKVVAPAQDEYDYVMGVYAGAVSGYSLVVQYVNESTGPSPAKADFVLTPKDPPIVREVTGPMTGYTGQPALYAVVKQEPDLCRNDPARDVLCDVWRLKLNRNMARDAQNFVVFSIEWQARDLTPDLVLGVAGIGAIQDPNLDLFVWDTSSHVLERGQVGGESGGVPERVAFVATQDEYDIVVQISNGANLTYKITTYMSDELFDKPFELLDPVTGEPTNAPIADTSGGLIDPRTGEVVAPPLALAPIDIDSDIAGIGHGATEQFDLDEALRQGRAALRNASTSSDPPSGLILLLALVILPMGLFAAGVVVMRRRHNVLF